MTPPIIVSTVQSRVVLFWFPLQHAFTFFQDIYPLHAYIGPHFVCRNTVHLHAFIQTKLRSSMLAWESFSNFAPRLYNCFFLCRIILSSIECATKRLDKEGSADQTLKCLIFTMRDGEKSFAFFFI